MMVLYSLAMLVGLGVSAPWWVARMLTTQRYREGLWERLGRVPTALRAVVAGKNVVWVHAVSVGEVLAATRLVAELGEALGAEWVVVVSTTTRTGQALARERFGAEWVFYFPLDFAFAVRAYLLLLRPAAVVLMESEVWPRMLHECGRTGVPVVVVNARVSDRSFARGMKVRAVWGRVLRGVSLWLAQSEEDARRLVTMGARAESVRAVGNLKYDVRAVKESWIAELIQRVAAGRPVVVAGSTVVHEREYEDAMICEAWRGPVRLDGNAVLVLAPRHPEKFREVEARAHEFRTVSASALKEGIFDLPAFTESGEAGERESVELIVLDTVGDLAAVYGIADVAFVGGSLVERGGHNPLEPAQFGVPVIMGTSFENFRDVVAKMQAADAICIVKDEVELEGVMLGMLKDREAARAMGERGRRVFEEQQGATARAVEAILALVRR